MPNQHETPLYQPNRADLKRSLIPHAVATILVVAAAVYILTIAVHA